MGRIVRDTNLETRNARRKLAARGKPYWRALNQGLHIGYRKGKTGSTWLVRRLNDHGRYEEAKLSLADDHQDSDGIAIFDYVQAQKAAQAWHQKAVRVDAGLEDAPTEGYSVADAMRDYMRHYKVEGKALKATESTINAHILPALGHIQIAKLNTKRINDWHKALAEQPARARTRAGSAQNIKKLKGEEIIRPRRATANRILNVLKAALNHAWREGKAATDTPWRKVKPFKAVDAPVVRYLDAEECTRLLNACAPDFRMLAQAAIYTGARYGEIARMKVSDINMDSGTVMIRDTKTRTPRHVVLIDEAKDFFAHTVIGKPANAIIFAHSDGSAWGKSHQSRPLLEACKRAKIEPISFHILRHTHGSLLAMQGVPMPVIAKQLGHKDTRMTEKHYAHLSPSYVADTIRQNFPSLGLTESKTVQPLRLSRSKSK